MFERSKIAERLWAQAIMCEEAARLYRLAADQGLAYAQTRLGFFYETGHGGLEKNIEEAVRLYKLAADRGDDAARNVLGRLHR